MAEPTPPGPKTSGRIAGLIAVAVLVVGGYYGFIAKPVAKPDAAPAVANGASAPPADVAAAPEAMKPEAAKPGATDTAKAPATTTPGAPAAADSAPAPGPNAAPSFDIVRVEPSGETVIAGLAEPKSDVDVLDGSTTIGSAKANERGEWAIAVETPLKPGTHDLSIRTTSPDKKTQSLSEQRVAVEVPEPGKGEPLVVLNQPDAASRVLQKPVASTQTADAGTAGAPDAATTPDASNPVADADAAAKKAPDAAASAEKPIEPKIADATPAAPAGSDPTKTAEAAPTAEPAKPGDAPKTGDAKTADATPAPTDGSAPAATPADKAPDAVAGAEKPAAGAEVAKAAIAPHVTVDAVEFEDGKLFIAGSAATGQTVRIYVDGMPVGEAKPGEGGRWLLEAPSQLTTGRHVVRADQLDAGNGQVVVRAEVPFDRTEDVALLAPVATEGSGSGGASGAGTVPAPQNVIIRRGDNLWRISRRLYGKGVRFSTIYEANDDQIRNPHWIYPGQVFVLPAGDSDWTN